MRRISAVIPTYNSLALLDACIAGVLDQAGVEVFVAVVDNGSTDGSPAHVRRRWPYVEVVELRENIGYGAAVNEGAARLPRGDVLALNADAILASGALRELTRVLEDEPGVGVVAPRLVSGDGSTQASAHRFPTLTGLLAEAVLLDRVPHVGRFVDLHYRRYRYDRAVRVDWATGAVLLVRKEAWHAVHGFDPAYFFFVEELDLQRRVADAGWSVVLEPAALVTHWGGKRPLPPDRFLRSHDGLERYFALRGGRLQAVLARLLLCVTALTRAVGWTGIALARPGRRAEALRWASMFTRVFLASVRRLGRAALASHSPYRPRPGGASSVCH